jgi:hypothetical protein
VDPFRDTGLGPDRGPRGALGMIPRPSDFA